MRAANSGSVITAGEGEGVLTHTLVVLIWAFSSILWSIFTPPQYTFASRVLLFQSAWLLRALLGDSTWLQDLALFLPLHAAYGYLVGHWDFPRWADLQWLDPSDETMRLYFQIFALLAMCSMFAGGIVFRGHRLKDKDPEEPLHQQRIDEQVLPPLLLPSRTTHSRMSPKKHAFSYSYLYVGIPVGMHGRISRLLSIDSQQRGWFHVDSADYLDRGRAHSTLAEKLKVYLRTQGVTDRDYAFAYLITAPRFLGYSFNPVSFWYLYDSDTKLKYMILEVNNTFDERRMYLLKGDGTDDTDLENVPEQPREKTANTRRQLTFSDSWEKDFHVSPFNSRKGSYSLRATDPLAEYERSGTVHIDNTIVLRSSKEHPKIVARVFSEGAPKDAASISGVEAARFIASWCWVGFATFPRIVWQAAKLSLRRKLHVWDRPEVTDASISRPYNRDEKHLESFFRAFLSHVVHETSKPLRVVYEPAHSEGTEVVLYSPDFTYEEDHKRTLTLKMLSPAFYSRFVHYKSAEQTIKCECLAAEERNRTATIERTELLPELFEAIAEQSEIATKQMKTGSNPLDQVRWACMRRLRCPSSAPAYPKSVTDEEDAKAISAPTATEMDNYVQMNCRDSDTYRRIATKLFLAERVGLGIPALLTVLDYLLRSALLLVSMLYCDRMRPVDIFRPRNLDMNDLEASAIMLLLANSVHIWSFAKA